MGATFAEFALDMVPWVEDEKAIIKSEVMTMLEHEYFIHARTINGAFFLSENFGWEDAVKRFKEYKSLVNYFGGGQVIVYEITYEGDVEPVIDEICYWG